MGRYDGWTKGDLEAEVDRLRKKKSAAFAQEVESGVQHRRATEAVRVEIDEAKKVLRRRAGDHPEADDGWKGWYVDCEACPALDECLPRPKEHWRGSFPDYTLCVDPNGTWVLFNELDLLGQGAAVNRGCARSVVEAKADAVKAYYAEIE